MNILSLFDGMACGRIALERAGIKPDKYFASEIDKFAMKVSTGNYPDIMQLGDIKNYKEWDLPKIDFMMGGSPCQDLSRIKDKKGKGLHGEKSKLFFKYVEALHKFQPEKFLLENVTMNKESEDVITAILGVEPVMINSSHFSAQDRKRLYWTNIDFDKELPVNNDVLKDIMEIEVDEKYYYRDTPFEYMGENKRVIAKLDRNLTDMTSRVYNPNFKAPTLTAVCGGHQEKKVMDHKGIRKLTPLEYEKLQTVPEGYTASVSNSQRYKMLGNGWTVDVIAHILKGLQTK